MQLTQINLYQIPCIQQFDNVKHTIHIVGSCCDVATILNETLIVNFKVVVYNSAPSGFVVIHLFFHLSITIRCVAVKRILFWQTHIVVHHMQSIGFGNGLSIHHPNVVVPAWSRHHAKYFIFKNADGSQMGRLTRYIAFEVKPFSWLACFAVRCGNNKIRGMRFPQFQFKLAYACYV